MARVVDLSGNLPDSLNGTTGGVDKHIGEKGEVHRSYAVVASDTIDLPNGVTTALSVKTAGDYKINDGFGNTSTVNLIAGVWHPMEVSRVWSSGSASTAGINAGY